MNEDIQSQSRKRETQGNGPVKELEFQVSSVLSRLEEAVEKFESNSKETVSSLESSGSFPTSAKLPNEVINIIQDAIVKLDLSKEDSEQNLAILPALRDVDQLSLVSHSIKQYMLCLDMIHSDYLINWIENDTSLWLAQLFRFKGCKTFYDSSYLEGCLKLFRFLLMKKYPTYNQEGFESFKQNSPVIYYNSPSTCVVAQYLCCNSGLPLRTIQEIPPFVSKKLEEVETFRRKIEENLSQNQVPLLFLAEAETQRQPIRCNINVIRSVCQEYNVWLHLIGSSITVLPILRGIRDEQSANLFDSISVTLGPWLNIPSLPAATLYRVKEEDQDLVKSIESLSKLPMALPLWTSIQCFGEERILNDFIEKYDSCQKFYLKLEKYPCLRLLSAGAERGYSSIGDLINKPIKENDVFELAISCVIFKFLPENNKLWSSSYCDKLNSWLNQVLHRELSVVPITVIELEEHGTSLKYSPFSNMPTITEAHWLTFFSCLEQQLDILNATVAQKETLYKLLKDSTCLKLVELPDWAGLGGVRYIPEGWIRDNPENLSKDELNRLNQQIVQQLRNTDAAFSIGESVDGYLCIRFGMVGSDSDVLDLVSLVESVGKQEEESWNFIDTMAEVVKKGIQTALLDLQKENEEKLWQEGILRHVPVFGNIVNWWSPINKENGVKGRSLDLAAGVIESTENIYRYHMQGATKTLGMKSESETSVATDVVAAADDKSSQPQTVAGDKVQLEE